MIQTPDETGAFVPTYYNMNRRQFLVCLYSIEDEVKEFTVTAMSNTAAYLAVRGLFPHVRYTVSPGRLSI